MVTTDMLDLLRCRLKYLGVKYHNDCSLAKILKKQKVERKLMSSLLNFSGGDTAVLCTIFSVILYV